MLRKSGRQHPHGELVRWGYEVDPLRYCPFLRAQGRPLRGVRPGAGRPYERGRDVAACLGRSAAPAGPRMAGFGVLRSPIDSTGTDLRTALSAPAMYTIC